MIDTEFRFNKKKLASAFKEYLTKFDNGDEDFNPKHGKEVDYSKIDILKKIKNIYEWVLQESILELRQMYIHDDKKFNEIKNALNSHIVNKIKSVSDGTIYLKAGDIFTFSGNKEEYEEWVLKNKNNQERLIKSIVNEFNSLIDGTFKDDDNKPILNDDEYIEPTKEYTNEEMANFIFSKIDDSIFEERNNLTFALKIEEILQNLNLENSMIVRKTIFSLKDSIDKITEKDVEESNEVK